MVFMEAETIVSRASFTPALRRRLKAQIKAGCMHTMEDKGFSTMNVEFRHVNRIASKPVLSVHKTTAKNKLQMALYNISKFLRRLPTRANKPSFPPPPLSQLYSPGDHSISSNDFRVPAIAVRSEHRPLGSPTVHDAPR